MFLPLECSMGLSVDPLRRSPSAWSGRLLIIASSVHFQSPSLINPWFTVPTALGSPFKPLRLNLVCMLSHVRLFAIPWTKSPRDYLGKNIEVGCHFLLQGISWPRDRTHASFASCTGRRSLYHQAYLNPYFRLCLWEVSMIRLELSPKTSPLTSP